MYKRQDFFAEQRIAVRLGDGIEARVKARLGLGDIEDADGGRQKAVNGAAQVVGRDGIFERESRDLGKGVHTGVGAAGARNVNGVAFDAGDNLFEDCLLYTSRCV